MVAVFQNYPDVVAGELFVLQPSKLLKATGHIKAYWICKYLKEECKTFSYCHLIQALLVFNIVTLQTDVCEAPLSCPKGKKSCT